MKPENFVLGLGTGQDTVHMVDLGLATAWRREDGRHTEFGQERLMVGTTRSGWRWEAGSALSGAGICPSTLTAGGDKVGGTISSPQPT